jgi:Phosphate-selective porin O and P
MNLSPFSPRASSTVNVTVSQSPSNDDGCSAAMPGARAELCPPIISSKRFVTRAAPLALTMSALLTAAVAKAEDAVPLPSLSADHRLALLQQPAPLEPPPAVAPSEPALPPSYDAPPPPPVPAPAPVVEASAEPPKLPDRVGFGKNGGFVQFSSLIQPWFFMSRTQGDDDIFNSTFRLRRAEMVFKGEVVPKLAGFLVRIDPAKLLAARSIAVTGQQPAPTTPGSVSVLQPGGTDGSILQDAWVSFLSDYANVQIGQFKIPVSLEALQSSSALLFPERSLVTRAFGDRRELGLKVEKKIADFFFYSAGIYNGSNINRLDNDREKDAGLRLEVYPIPGLTIGALGYTTIGERDQSVVDRLEADLRLELAGLIVQGEYIHGWDGAPNATTGDRLEGAGAYAAIAYTFLERFQPAFRIGFVDTNVDNEDAGRTNAVEGCLNYFLRGNDVKVSLSVGHFTPDPAPDFTEVTLQTQFSF